MTRYEIRRALPTQIAAPLLDEALGYLGEHAIVHDEGPGGKVSWIRPGPKADPARTHGRSRSTSAAPHRGQGRLARLVRKHRRQILAIAARHGINRVRLFGSVARGEDDQNSDVDILVRLEPGRSLLDHIAFKQYVQELLGVNVDVVSEGGVSPYIRKAVLKEAVPV